jgi:hypothetical protein
LIYPITFLDRLVKKNALGPTLHAHGSSTRSLQGSDSSGGPKDLRDYFCTEVAANSYNSNVAMRLMTYQPGDDNEVHAAVEERMRDAVEKSCGRSGCGLMITETRNADLAKLEKIREVAKILESYGFLKGKVGGGGRSRTYDAADMSRVL